LAFLVFKSWKLYYTKGWLRKFAYSIGFLTIYWVGSGVLIPKLVLGSDYTELLKSTYKVSREVYKI